MEWVQTTGRTLDEAKTAALDQLGVEEADAEFEILAEPKAGLFGRLRGEARLRARIRPRQHRPKLERCDRRRRNAEPAGETPSASDPATPSVSTSGAKRHAPAAPAAEAQPRRRSPRAKPSSPVPPSATRASGSVAPAAESLDHRPKESTMSATTPTLDEQASQVEQFLQGLVDAFGLVGTVERRAVDEETVELAVLGDDLGLLIGPKGQTIQALHELARTVLYRGGALEGRIRIDVGGYRERRRAALERFATQVAESVLASGQAKALEPMAPPDRKVVHDVINGIDGVVTTSEGEEPRRRVVVRPA
ncbi:MAG: Jag N-terminal domain-containing protein [Actinobacteria bacterium]|nr:Jag N-terminal domain-containing protein [Actinomycetota bacterium]